METLINFKTFVDEIQQNNSRNYKLEVLRKYKDNANIKRYLDFIYNPYKITGISEKKLYKEIWMESEEVTSMYELMDYLLTHNTGRDEDICKVQQFKDTLDVDYYEIFDAIITKSLTLGVDVLSINKCMGDFIPVFSVQLANKYFDKPEIVEGKSFALTTKIDGGRIIAIKENGKVTFYTRQGQLYEGLVDLEQEMLEKLPDNICLDGEITLLDPWITEDTLFGTTDDHMIGRKLSSKEQYKETMKITRKDGEKHGVKMLVFDCMTAEEFRNQKCDTTYGIRRGELLCNFQHYYEDECFKVAKEFEKNNFPEGWSSRNELEAYNKYMFDWKNNLINFLNTKYTYFNILPLLYQGSDTNEITKWLNYNIEHGEEGVMINILDAPYEFRRTSNLLKVKKMLDLDLEVVGVEEGTGNFSGMCGALLVRYKEGNIVKVGSGLSKELRQEIWKDPNSYIGKIISVQYFEETTNQNNGLSLRFPVFLEFRNPADKNVADF